MPQSDGGYVSLGSNTVYNSTTESTTAAHSIIESVKRRLGNVIGTNDNQSLLGSNDSKPFIISSR